MSSDQNAFSSRTAGFIVQQNFPPNIQNRPSGPLVGVNFSNLSFSDVNRFKDPHTNYSTTAFGGGGTNGAPITGLAWAALSGLAGSPGGVPLYQNGKLVGGVGAAVTGQLPIPELYDIQTDATQQADLDEEVALAGQIGFEPANTILGTGVFIDGIRLPYVSSQIKQDAVMALGSIGSVVAPFTITNSPPVGYPAADLGGIVGELRAPIIGDPITNLIDGVARLTASEVTNILTLAAQRAAITRAGIRLPAGQPAQVFISVVNNPDQPGTADVPHERRYHFQLGRLGPKGADRVVLLQSTDRRSVATGIDRQGPLDPHGRVPGAKALPARHSGHCPGAVARFAGTLLLDPPRRYQSVEWRPFFCDQSSARYS